MEHEIGASRGRRRSSGALLQKLRAFFGMLLDGDARVEHGQRFLILMGEGSFRRIYTAFAATPAGRRLLSERPDVRALLYDRERLSRLPEGSIGRAYADFVAVIANDVRGLVSAPENSSDADDPAAREDWLRDRIEATHDVRHILAGYPATRLGEVCLLAFRAAQTGHVGAGVVAILSTPWALLEAPTGLPAILEAIRRARRARYLDLAAFELDLAAPLAGYQAALGLEPPRAFRRAEERARRLRTRDERLSDVATSLGAR